MEKIHVKRYNKFIPMSGFWATVIGKIFYIKEKKNYYLIWRKRYGGSHFAYLISEPFFAPLLLCFVSWGWLNPTVQASVFSSSIHPVRDTGESWDWREQSGYFRYLIAPGLSPPWLQLPLDSPSSHWHGSHQAVPCCRSSSWWTVPTSGIW